MNDANAVLSAGDQCTDSKSTESRAEGAEPQSSRTTPELSPATAAEPSQHSQSPAKRRFFKVRTDHH
jgi:hypothetical protein